MLNALAATQSELENLNGGAPLRRRFTRAQMLLLGAGLAISAAFMYIAVRNAQPRQTVDALRALEYVWLPAGLVLLAVAFVIRAIRWQSLFPPTSRPALRDVTAALFVGYLANAVLPLRAGDAVAIVALSRRTGRTIAETTATALVQRAQDVLSLVFLLFLILPWLPPVSWLQAAGLIALVLLVSLALLSVTVLRFGDRAAHVLLRPLRSLPFVPAEAVERAPRQFVLGLSGLLSARVAMASFAWTTLSWAVLGIGFWLVMEASALALSPLAGLLVVIGIGLAMILPSSPAALGVFEGATVVVLGAYGIEASAALSYALVLHALNVVPLFVVALALAVRRQVLSRARQTPSAFEP